MTLGSWWAKGPQEISAVLLQGWPVAAWAAPGRLCQQVMGGNLTLILSTCEMYLQCQVQFLTLQYKNDMDFLEQVQHRAMKMIKRPENLTDEEGLRGLQPFSLGKRRPRVSYQCIQIWDGEKCRESQALPTVPSDRTRRLKLLEFHLVATEGIFYCESGKTLNDSKRFNVFAFFIHPVQLFHLICLTTNSIIKRFFR